MSKWFVYLLKCSDGTFYTGITTDVDRRVEEHNNGPKGAKYTKARRPVHLVYQEVCVSRSEAGQREYTLRTLPRSEKIKLSNSLGI